MNASLMVMSTLCTLGEPHWVKKLMVTFLMSASHFHNTSHQYKAPVLSVIFTILYLENLTFPEPLTVYWFLTWTAEVWLWPLPENKCRNYHRRDNPSFRHYNPSRNLLRKLLELTHYAFRNLLKITISTYRGFLAEWLQKNNHKAIVSWLISYNIVY